MLIGPALDAVTRATTVDTVRSVNTYDAVVVGAGATGGLAALLLTEAGLRVLVLDAGWPPSGSRAMWRRGSNVLARRLADPAIRRFVPPAAVPLGRLALRSLGWLRQPIQSRSSVWGREPTAFVDDRDCPYETKRNQPFVWLRARQIGGRMAVLSHGRQYYRLSPKDFAPTDQLTSAWPLEAGELDPWYSLVERRLDLAGARDGVPWQPDSDISRVIEPTADEFALMTAIRLRWPNARPMLGRFAPPLPALEAAALTGRLRCRKGAIVKRVDVDRSGGVQGVTWLDQQSGSEEHACGPLVFLCASALESTRLLLLSRAPESPEGLGGASYTLGRYLMDHITVSGYGEGPPLRPGPFPEQGRSVHLPRFDAREELLPGPGRGFGVQLCQFPGRPGRSRFTAVTFGEMLPRAENRINLHPTRRDAWGIPILQISCRHYENDLALAREQAVAIREIAAAAGFTLGRANLQLEPPGAAAHECGTARMGRSPTDSVLDPNNQCWEARGLYVTDGACFPSQGSQNPTLTMLALTARACHHALAATPIRIRQGEIPE